MVWVSLFSDVVIFSGEIALPVCSIPLLKSPDDTEGAGNESSCFLFFFSIVSFKISIIFII